MLKYDATRNNELGYEYMLMSMFNGRSFEDVRKEMPEREYEDHLEGFLNQVVDIISELDSHNWNHIGGFQEITGTINDENGKEDAKNGSLIVPGQS